MKTLNRFTALVLLLVMAGFSACHTHYKLREKETITSVIALDSTFAEEDSTALAIIAPYKASMTAEMEEVIAYADQALSKAQPEGLLNNFVTDLVLRMVDRYYTDEPVDLCLMNNGGLRSSLPKGEIKTKNVFELLPFENRLTIMHLSGSKTLGLFNYVAREGGMPLSGARMGIKEDAAVNILIRGKALDTTATYRVVTVDYLADGGDKMNFFNNPLQRTDLPVLIREVMILYLKELTAAGKTVNAELDGRVYYEQ